MAPLHSPSPGFCGPSGWGVGELADHRSSPPQLRTFCWTTYPPPPAPEKMAASMHASRSMSVATSRTTKAAATRFARVGQRAVRPTSRSAVVVKAGESGQQPPDHRCNQSTYTSLRPAAPNYVAEECLVCCSVNEGTGRRTRVLQCCLSSWWPAICIGFAAAVGLCLDIGSAPVLPPRVRQLQLPLWLAALPLTSRQLPCSTRSSWTAA